MSCRITTGQYIRICNFFLSWIKDSIANYGKVYSEQFWVYVILDGQCNMTRNSQPRYMNWFAIWTSFHKGLLLDISLYKE